MARVKYDDVVLVTGYPEMQARLLVHHILEVEPKTKVVVVVVSTRHERAKADLAGLPAAQRSRVECIDGDVAAMDLGLSGSEFRELASRIGRLHHVAHVSYVGVDRETAEYANIRTAVEVIELARAASNLRAVVHHSTAYVAGDRKGLVYENELDERQGFPNVVQETRMKAELVMRRAMPDLPVIVVRPTMLVGDSTTGQADRFDGPHLLVLLLLGLPGDMAVPLPAESENPIDIVPVDYVVRAAHHIGRQTSSVGKTFHLTSSEALTIGEVFELIAQAGGAPDGTQFHPHPSGQCALAYAGRARRASTTSRLHAPAGIDCALRHAQCPGRSRG